MTSERPKASLVGFGDLALSAYNTAKIRGVDAEISRLSSGLDSSFKLQRAEVREKTNQIESFQFHAMNGLRVVHNEIGSLKSGLAEVNETLQRIENRDEITANLRLKILKIEEEIEKIRGYSENYPEYATLMAENLSSITSDLDISSFKHMNGDDLRWARDVLNSIGALKTEMHQLIGL